MYPLSPHPQILFWSQSCGLRGSERAAVPGIPTALSAPILRPLCVPIPTANGDTAKGERWGEGGAGRGDRAHRTEESQREAEGGAGARSGRDTPTPPSPWTPFT